MEPFSIEVEGFTYQYNPGRSQLFCLEPFTGDPALPRHFIYFSGLLFELSSLTSIHPQSGGDNVSLRSICIPSSIVSLNSACLYGSTTLAFVAFEHGSQLSAIGTIACQCCRSLTSIFLPSGVQTIGRGSFNICGLSNVTFAAHARLSVIQDDAFCQCPNLHSICLPAGLQQIKARGLPWPTLQYIQIEEGNQHFSTSGSYLLDFAGISILGYIGTATELCISNCIEEL
jgi:hypothetical protein